MCLLDQCLCYFIEQRISNYSLQEGKGVLLRMSLAVDFFKPLCKHKVVNGDGEEKLLIKLECRMHGGLLYKLFFLNTLSPLLIHLIAMITHAAGLSKFFGKIRSPEVVYKAEDEAYFIGGRNGHHHRGPAQDGNL